MHTDVNQQLQMKISQNISSLFKCYKAENSRPTEGKLTHLMLINIVWNKNRL